MLQISLLILAVFLIFRLGIGVVQKLHDRNGIGKSFRRMMAQGSFGDDVYDGARWQTVQHFGKKHLRSTISPEKQRLIRERKRAEREAYLDSCKPSLYQYVIIFLIASVLGLVIETVYIYIMFGIVESRVGLVWGPFSPLYGFGAVLLTVVLWQLRRRPAWMIFIISSILGGALEQVTGWSMEHFMNAQSWTYLGLPDHITQWVAWRFLLIWGVIGLVWCKLIMPEMIYRIGEPTERRQKIVVALLAAFMVLDIVMTLLCLYRADERSRGIPPSNPIEKYVDIHFNDAFVNEKFENMLFNKDIPVSTK